MSLAPLLQGLLHVPLLLLLLLPPVLLLYLLRLFVLLPAPSSWQQRFYFLWAFLSLS
jgi:hypothetical protein